MANMVALLRARGGYPVEQVAGAFQMTVTEIDKLSTESSPAWDMYVPQWSRETFAREARRFFKREGRWPKSSDFRDMKMRRMGLPSWDHLRVTMLGWDRRTWGAWNQRSMQPALRRLRDQGLVLESESMPDNGWVVLQRWMVLNLDLSPQEILALPNALIRREGMEKYGFDRMVREGFAEHIATDETGSLYRFPGERKAEPLIILKVVNKTREPDGTFAEYFLRVPPTMTIPKQAVAWTFNVTEDWESFAMVVET